MKHAKLLFYVNLIKRGISFSFYHTTAANKHSSLFRLCEGHLQYIIGKRIRSWVERGKRQQQQQQNRITVRPQIICSGHKQYLSPADQSPSRLHPPSQTNAWSSVVMESFLGIGLLYVISSNIGKREITVEINEITAQKLLERFASKWIF